MRKTPIVLLLAGLALAASPRSSSAQDVISAHVPFPFVVEGRVLPPGDYQVLRDDASYGNHLLIIQSRDGGAGVVTLYEDAGTADMSTPVTFQFKTVGERRYLSAITEPGAAYDLLLPHGLTMDTKQAKASADKSRKGND